jgi:hypothetical protein
MAARLPAERPCSLALEALLYDLEINPEQVSTAGEKECFMSISLGRGVRIILGYNTHDGAASTKAFGHCRVFFFC